jgi:histidinol dehydrogenase
MIRVYDIKNAPLRRNAEGAEDAKVEASVRGILKDVREEGDAALKKYAEKFDGQGGEYRIRIGMDEIRAAYARVPPAAIAAMEFAIRNQGIACKKFKPKNAKAETEGGSVEQVFTPIGRVGIYAPGGRAAYPSSVIMAAIPAKVAGVPYICLCTPPPVSPVLLVAADLCGIGNIFAVGGAQAIGAMAYGTETVPKVDKIVGPGNKYVLAAKNMVRGISCDIDMPAGPSEVLIVADESANFDWAAADLLAQLEHDPDAIAVLLGSEGAVREICNRLEQRLEKEPRAGIIRKSAENSYAVIADMRDLERTAKFVNEFAPEHLQIMLKEEGKLLSMVRNAGSVFVGNECPAVLGDYCIGSNHVLPTGGSARFASALSVLSFMKESTVVRASGEKELYERCAQFAKAEGFAAHERAVRLRLGK